ncbi:extracellular solute-binding protein [Paenibacillus sp. GCM10027626]|uniref:extracellular solute-binding protein n=1 Tax=Paenibacillus sp. GCM10027626 TaxID=3273411 RepID=UPI0036254DCF
MKKSMAREGRTMKRRRGNGKFTAMPLLTAILLTIALLASACSNNANVPRADNKPPAESPDNTAETAPEQQEENRDPVTIKLIASDAGSPVLKARTDAFTKKYPWITVELIEPEWSPEGVDKPILEKVAALQAAGTPADIVRLEDMTSAVSGGVIEDLAPYMKSDPELGAVKYREGIIDNFIHEGKQYAVPIEMATFLVYINKDLMEKHGMEMPANDWTYDTFWDMMRKATHPNDSEYGLNTNMHSNFVGLIYSYANGSSPNLFYLDQDKKQSVLSTPEVQSDLKMVQETVMKDDLLPSEEEGSKKGIDHINLAFTQGKALFSVEGIWVFQDMQKNLTFNWDILPLPKGKEKQATIHMLPAYSLLSGSKNKEAAVKFLAFTGSEEYAKLNIDMGGLPFIEKDGLDDYLMNHQNFEGKNKEAVKVIGSMCCKVSGALIPGFGIDYLQPIYDFQYAIMRKGGDISTLSAQVADKFNKRTIELRKQFEGQ